MATMAKGVAARRIAFPADSTIGNVERTLDAFFESTSDTPTSIVLDLSQCRYIEVSSLIFLIAFVKSRVDAGYKTIIRVPRLKTVRDFLRIWGFPKAIRQATGVYFWELVAEPDRIYFGENANPTDVKYAGRLLDHSVERLLSDKFFAVTTIFVSEAMSRTRLVMEETRRWEEDLVKSILAKHLKGPEGYFASRIIFECMTNSLRHPNANIIQTASRFTAPSTKKGKRHQVEPRGQFTIVFWDDGQSIIDTLKSAIAEGQSVRSSQVPDFQEAYRVELEDAPGEDASTQLIRSDFVPDERTSDALVLLSAVLPGITRDVTGESHMMPTDTSVEDPRLSSPGMGLYILTNCVIDIFGGSVAFRTAEYFMNIGPCKGTTPSTARYDVKIRRMPEKRPSFLGNMLTVRLPVRTEVRPEYGR